MFINPPKLLDRTNKGEEDLREILTKAFPKKNYIALQTINHFLKI